MELFGSSKSEVFYSLSTMDLEKQIEGVLFYKTEPVKKTLLIGLFDVADEVLEEALLQLSSRLQHGGTRVVMTDTTVQLVVAPELSEIIETLRKDELKKDIGKAGAETLAIILYRGPISRAEIDRIRGVNSNFILRNLLIRGLIERREHPSDQRSFMYAITPNLLNHLGITRREELPEFPEIMNALETYERHQQETESQHNLTE